MSHEIGILLKQIDRESLVVHRNAGLTKQHLTLEDFANALAAYENLDSQITRAPVPTSTEAFVYGTFYSALAFRLIDASTRYDEPKFRKAQEIIGRAEEITMDCEPIVHLAKYYMQKKLAQYMPDDSDITKRADHFLDYLASNEYARLFFDIGNLLRLKHIAKTSGQRARKIRRFVYEFVRTAAFLSFSISGAKNFRKGEYIVSAIELAIAASIPISRYYRRKKEIKEILGGGYELPKLKPIQI